MRGNFFEFKIYLQIKDNKIENVAKKKTIYQVYETNTWISTIFPRIDMSPFMYMRGESKIVVSK